MTFGILMKGTDDALENLNSSEGFRLTRVGSDKLCQ